MNHSRDDADALSQRQTAIGQLVEGLAHDMNSPLSAVITNLSVLDGHVADLSGIARAAQELLPDLLADPRTSALAASLDAAVRGADLAYTLDDLPVLLEESTVATRRVAQLIAGMATFARRDSGPPALVEIRDVLAAALVLTSNPLRPFVVTVSEDAAAPPVLGHAAELSELFVRLLINAAQALERRAGTVTLTSSVEDGSVVVRIGDSGPGISPDDVARVFEAHFTTRASTGAAGMGLAVCAAIVARHGGSIRLDSEASRGTTVTVTLPAAEIEQAPD